MLLQPNEEDQRANTIISLNQNYHDFSFNANTEQIGSELSYYSEVPYIATSSSLLGTLTGTQDKYFRTEGVDEISSCSYTASGKLIKFHYA